MATPTASILTWLALAVNGNGDTIPANDAHRSELAILRQRFATEGEAVHDDALAALKDASAGRSQMLAIVEGLS